MDVEEQEFWKTVFSVFSMYIDLVAKYPEQTKLIEQTNRLLRLSAMKAEPTLYVFPSDHRPYRKRLSSLAILEMMNQTSPLQFSFNRNSTKLNVTTTTFGRLFTLRTDDHHQQEPAYYTNKATIKHKSINQIGTVFGRQNALATMFLESPLGILVHKSYQFHNCMGDSARWKLKSLLRKMCLVYGGGDGGLVNPRFMYGYLKSLEHKMINCSSR
jgi:hypothetical protein